MSTQGDEGLNLHAEEAAGEVKRRVNMGNWE